MKRIITISREFGSGGRTIGKDVAEKLGYAFYDKELIERIAEQSGLSKEYIDIVEELAEKGNCVIVGRCADYILRKRTDCLLDSGALGEETCAELITGLAKEL